jgi:hypothetical protein
LLIFGDVKEAFKFSLYITLPILSGFIYANPKVMRDLSKSNSVQALSLLISCIITAVLDLKLVEYPEAGPAPPVGDEFHALLSSTATPAQQRPQGPAGPSPAEGGKVKGLP